MDYIDKFVDSYNYTELAKLIGALMRITYWIVVALLYAWAIFIVIGIICLPFYWLYGLIYPQV